MAEREWNLEIPDEGDIVYMNTLDEREGRTEQTRALYCIAERLEVLVEVIERIAPNDHLQVGADVSVSGEG